ncbi:hypothetical protein EI94DRAFT_86948 [Lactarius quietus]|nr:hypothetical protein EI94DRAFT_86948 [Lactarius quietus]
MRACGIMHHLSIFFMVSSPTPALAPYGGLGDLNLRDRGHRSEAPCAQTPVPRVFSWTRSGRRSRPFSLPTQVARRRDGMKTCYGLTCRDS